jgi:hypothetical protein
VAMHKVRCPGGRVLRRAVNVQWSSRFVVKSLPFSHTHTQNLWRFVAVSWLCDMTILVGLAFRFRV